MFCQKSDVVAGCWSHDLGRFCVLQPDLIEKKEISSFFQMHFKLLRFFCSGQDTKTIRYLGIIKFFFLSSKTIFPFQNTFGSDLIARKYPNLARLGTSDH